MKTSRFSHHQKTSRSRRKLLLAGTVLVIFLAVGGYLVYKRSQHPEADKNAVDPTNTSAKATAPELSGTQNDDGTPLDATSDQIPANPDLSLQITELNQQNNTVTARAVITSSGSGNCVFSFATPEGRPVVKQVASQTANGSQGCSVSIPEVEFDKLGEWELTVSFYYNNAKAEASRKVMIN